MSITITSRFTRTNTPTMTATMTTRTLKDLKVPTATCTSIGNWPTPTHTSLIFTIATTTSADCPISGARTKKQHCADHRVQLVQHFTNLPPRRRQVGQRRALPSTAATGTSTDVTCGGPCALS